ncbi:hypothetical protein Nmel_018917, partial [Mimus melanotis]
VHGPGDCTSCPSESRCPQDGVPGLSWDCDPRAPRVITELCLPHAPGTVPGDPSLLPLCTPGCPGTSRAIPVPRFLCAPGAVRGRPRLFRDQLLLAPGAVADR